MAKQAAAPDYSAFATKPLTEHQEFLASWLGEATGAKIDKRTVMITLALVNKFQQSPENKEWNKAHRAERAAALKEKASKAAPVKKSTVTKKAAASKPPVKKSTAAPVKKAAAKKTTVKRAATKPSEAPF